jgi:Leucine-rich repeat (LRR) protein
MDSMFTLNGKELDADLLTSDQQKFLVKVVFCRKKTRMLSDDISSLNAEIKEIETDLELFIIN